MRWTGLACGFVVALTAFPVFAQSIKAGTIWQNDKGSILTISSIDSAGAITGTYLNKAIGFDCSNEAFSATGWIDGDKIGFSVRWKNANKDCSSITSWTGYYASGRIFSDWSLVYDDSVETRPLIFEGSDFFVPK